MTDVEAGNAIEYGALIKEVFIDPIRTLVVVDDEYPTLEGLLDDALTDEDKKVEPRWKAENLKRAREITSFCHQPKQSWMLEIHNGSPAMGEEAVHHLSYSDLMILDFHLNSADPSDATRAIEILRTLAKNDQFNLVVVHTKGYDNVGGDIQKVVQEISVGLTTPPENAPLSEQGLSAANSILENWENTEPDIVADLLSRADIGACLKLHRLPTLETSVIRNLPELASLLSKIDEYPEKLEEKKKKLLVKWVLHKTQEKYAAKFSPVNLGEVDSRWDVDGTNWVRSDRLFVTVVSKRYSPDTLPEKLLNALERWAPAPHRLLMSKMRTELAEGGVLAEAEVLSNQYLQAGWLSEYVTANAPERTWKIKNAVNRHWEGLGDAIQKNVLIYAERLGAHLATLDRNEAFKKYLSFDPNEPGNNQNIFVHLNKYACSKAVDGSYLSTGHVLKTQEDNDFCYWLCLSPACDLVPGQKSGGWFKRLGNFTAFKAVQIFKVDKEHALANAAAGNHLFLEVENSIECFQFTPHDKAAREANPKWEQMFIAGQGEFNGHDFTLSLVRIESDNSSLVTRNISGKVVAQLRYEYALNLLQRLGANLARVGLDFIPMQREGAG